MPRFFSWPCGANVQAPHTTDTTNPVPAASDTSRHERPLAIEPPAPRFYAENLVILTPADKGCLSVSASVGYALLTAPESPFWEQAKATNAALICQLGALSRAIEAARQSGSPELDELEQRAAGIEIEIDRLNADIVSLPQRGPVDTANVARDRLMILNAMAWGKKDKAQTAAEYAEQQWARLNDVRAQAQPNPPLARGAGMQWSSYVTRRSELVGELTVVADELKRRMAGGRPSGKRELLSISIYYDLFNELAGEVRSLDADVASAHADYLKADSDRTTDIALAEMEYYQTKFESSPQVPTPGAVAAVILYVEPELRGSVTADEQPRHAASATRQSASDSAELSDQKRHSKPALIED
ncbi:hypothetical protein GHT07_12130 [Caenimonas koreensis DSM 17982]|uniref:Uncharacterized protein n=1 Tax=Caenimonas koreensis DSM 17982 TaxID=1121255 RepID=A0A844B481_9BURK|nr:hypothetical protein [Caenimonas koreensis]MRD48032.1 hypothetical protein [Caenimonas koreensis DSM 17982]